ncbi:MAG: hypothetical protein AAGF95_07035 [Chloroflexota bacterium]
MQFVKHKLLVLGVLLIYLMQPVSVYAHAGPPYLVVTEQVLGPYLVTAWADPDVGTGLFIIEAMIDETLAPEGTIVTVSVEPEDGQVAPAQFASVREQRLFGGEQFTIQAQFDFEGPWNINMIIEGPAGRGETDFVVLVTPPGPGWLVSVVCLLPFVGLGVVWLFAIQRQKRQGVEEQGTQPT